MNWLIFGVGLFLGWTGGGGGGLNTNRSLRNGLVGLKTHANGRNKCQQVTTLLGVVGQQCCVRLHGPKSLTGFKLHATSANKCQHCCGSMQTDATSHNIVGPNNVGCCWPTMLGPFARAFITGWRLYVSKSFNLERQGRHT